MPLHGLGDGPSEELMYPAAPPMQVEFFRVQRPGNNDTAAQREALDSLRAQIDDYCSRLNIRAGQVTLTIEPLAYIAVLTWSSPD